MERSSTAMAIEPMHKRGLVALLKAMKPLEENFPEIDDPVPARENMF
jgi:antitoxin VapB